LSAAGGRTHRDERPLRATGIRKSGLGRAVRPCSSPVRQSLAGTERPEASGRTDTGLGSQRRNLVQRGQRPGVLTRRGVTHRFAGGTGSGAEASSPPLDVSRSVDRGVEEATGIPCVWNTRQLRLRPPFILIFPVEQQCYLRLPYRE